MSLPAGPKRAALFRAAAQAWNDHRPHEAITMLREGGADRATVDAFVRTAQRRARQRAIRLGVAR